MSSMNWDLMNGLRSICTDIKNIDFTKATKEDLENHLKSVQRQAGELLGMMKKELGHK